MRRMPHLDHHVVRDVDDRIDAADARSLEPVAQPRRRRAETAHLEHLCAIPRTELRVFDDNLERLRIVRWWQRSIGKCQRQRIRRRCLPSQTDHAETIGTIRGDLEVDDGLRPLLD